MLFNVAPLSGLCAVQCSPPLRLVLFNVAPSQACVLFNVAPLSACVLFNVAPLSGLCTVQCTPPSQACVLFNVAALYSQLAAKVDRESQGLTKAVDLLEKAAGMFEYVRDKFSQAPSPDLSTEMLSMLADLMRVSTLNVLAMNCYQEWQYYIIIMITPTPT